MLIAYDPLPVPFVSLLPDVVGAVDIPQQIPLSVTVEAQFPEIEPPVDTDVDVGEVRAVVVTVGKTEPVVKVRSEPYAVNPASFEA